MRFRINRDMYFEVLRAPDGGSMLNGDVVSEWSRSRVEHASEKETTSTQFG